MSRFPSGGEIAAAPELKFDRFRLTAEHVEALLMVRDVIVGRGHDPKGSWIDAEGLFRSGQSGPVSLWGAVVIVEHERKLKRPTGWWLETFRLFGAPPDIDRHDLDEWAAGIPELALTLERWATARKWRS